MKTKERRERLQNKGFTLIELIVTIAIIAIFSGVVLTFISTGSNTYRSTSSSAKVQMETQETFDQIEELIIDVNRSLYYANGSGDSLGAEIRNDIKQSGGANSTGDKTFIICNEYKNGTGNSQYICDVLDWDKDDATIYYSQKEFKAASSSVESETSVEALMAAEDDTEEENAADAGASESETKAKDLKTKVDRSVLATGILDFRADVSKVESDKIVRFQLSTQNGTKEIETLHSVSLRNTVEVKKPADSYDDAPSTSVGIKIINAPSSVDLGNSYTLDYDLTGNGKIDPTTVKWEVTANKENGSFPTADPTYGKLTLSDTASGTITVIVSARTVDGDMITSAPVTISINGKAATPESFTLSTNSILVAADGSYDLSTIISGALGYSDGTSANTKNPITWSLKTSCTEVSLNGNSLAVTNEAGKDSTSGTVTLTATEKDSGANKSADLEVRIARIDLTQPVGTYKVGDAKPSQPRYAYTYMEAGAVAQNKVYGTMVSVNIVKADGSNGNYITGADTFSSDDVGKWNATISYDLSNRGGYGTVRSQSTFTVESKKQNQNIMIAGDSSTIVGGQVYKCSYYNKAWGFYFPAEFDGNWRYQLTWYIENKTSADTKFLSTQIVKDSDGQVELQVGADEHALTVAADMIVYKENTGNILYEFHGTRNVKVITGVNIIEPVSDTVVVGKTYQLKGEIEVWDQGKRTTLADGEKYLYWKIENAGDGYDSNTQTWTVKNNNNDVTLTLGMKNDGIPDVFNSTSRVLETTKKMNIVEPTYTLTLKDSANNTSKVVKKGETQSVTFNADFACDGEATTYNGMKWFVVKENETINPNYGENHWTDKNTGTAAWTYNLPSDITPGKYKVVVYAYYTYKYNDWNLATSNEYSLIIE